jgi:FtsZ-interacting cell division protein ZipA
MQAISINFSRLWTLVKYYVNSILTCKEIKMELSLGTIVGGLVVIAILALLFTKRKSTESQLAEANAAPYKVEPPVPTVTETVEIKEVVVEETKPAKKTRAPKVGEKSAKQAKAADKKPAVKKPVAKKAIVKAKKTSK